MHTGILRTALVVGLTALVTCSDSNTNTPPPPKDGGAKDTVSKKDNGGRQDTGATQDTGGGKDSGGTITPQAKVQDATGVTCKGATVTPKINATAYPCDTAVTGAAVRTVLGKATSLAFAAGNWAADDCSKSTLCGQQHDQSLLFQHQSPASSFNAVIAVFISSTMSGSDVLSLGYKCLRNFPQKNPTPGAVDPLMPVSDVRTGEVVIKTSDNTFHRARVEVVIDAKKAPGTDLSGHAVGLVGGAEIATAADLIAALANSSGDPASATFEVRKAADVAFTVTVRVTCLKNDTDVKTP